MLYHHLRLNCSAASDSPICSNSGYRTIADQLHSPSPSTTAYPQSVMLSRGPKLRQTCDPCRKAKVRCNKKLPTCGRCMASGAPCNYGVSNQGGRWKNGEKMGSRETRETEAAPLPAEQPPDGYSPDTSALVRSSLGEGTVNCWEQPQSEDIWMFDAISPQAAFAQWTAPPTPSDLSSLSSHSSSWPVGVPFEPEHLQQLYISSMASTTEGSIACSCLVSTLQLLQDLHQRYPQFSTTQPTDISSLSYASVLHMNEETVSCCSTMLRCPSCQKDVTGDSLILLASLIGKTLSLNEAWITKPDTKESSEAQCQSSPSLSHTTCQDEERKLKAEVSLIGIKKIEGVLVQLRQAGQSLKLDYDRLTCASLTASLFARLKSILETLGLEQDVGTG